MAWRLEHYEQLPSTNTLCMERARAGEPAGLAILAASQTAGRGTYGRAWSAAPGNLLLSALLRPGMPLADASQWSLRAGLATIEALQAHAPAAALCLKWPNDILQHGAKLAGILIESDATPDDRLAFLVIGVGANLATAPVLPGRSTACLAPSAPPSPTQVAATLLARLDHWAAAPFAQVRDAWAAQAHPIGTPMTLTVAGQQIRGTYAGLSHAGALRLATAGIMRTYTAGEASLSA